MQTATIRELGFLYQYQTKRLEDLEINHNDKWVNTRVRYNNYKCIYVHVNLCWLTQSE